MRSAIASRGESSVMHRRRGSAGDSPGQRRGGRMGHLSEGAVCGCCSTLSDRSFGHDVGFYVFKLPLLESWRDSSGWLQIPVLGGRGRRRYPLDARVSWIFRESPLAHQQLGGGAYLGAAGTFFIQRAYSYWLSRAWAPVPYRTASKCTGCATSITCYGSPLGCGYWSRCRIIAAGASASANIGQNAACGCR